MLPLSSSLQFWPGDDVQKNLLEWNEYQNLSSSRMKSVQEFLHIPLFTSATLKDAISSIPRWRFVRETQSSKPDGVDSSVDLDSDEVFEYVSVSNNLKGVARGQRGVLEDSRRILKGGSTSGILP